MDDSLFARLGYDPVRIFNRIHGHKPTGMATIGQPPAEPEPAEPAEQPPDEAQTQVNPPRACLGEVAAAPAADGGAEATADETEHAQRVKDPSTPAPAAPRSPSPSELGEDLEKPARDRLSASPEVWEWLTQNWDAIGELAEDGRLPELGRAPPLVKAPPPPPPTPPPVHVRKGDRWNKPKMAEFLRQLAATHSVSAAAQAVGMHRRSAYKLRARLKGQPFDIAWEAAFRQSYDNLAHSALELALEGEEVPHYYQGELVATHRKRNSSLIVQLLKMRNRAGAPMLGRYGAAAEYWGDRWDLLLDRVERGPVDWSQEHAALEHAEPDEAADREATLLIARNDPDERPGRSKRP